MATVPPASAVTFPAATLALAASALAQVAWAVTASVEPSLFTARAERAICWPAASAAEPGVTTTDFSVTLLEQPARRASEMALSVFMAGPRSIDGDEERRVDGNPLP